MKKILYTILILVCSLSGSSQVFDFYNSIYYLSPDEGMFPGTELMSSESNLSGFDFSTAAADHPMYTTGLYYPIQDCSNQNLWIRVQHIAADPNGVENGHAIYNSMNSPFLPWGSTDRIGGWNGFYYEFNIFQDENLTGTRAYTLGNPFPTGITVASLETLYNDGGTMYEWLAFEIMNEESSGWFLNSTNFTGINPYSTPGFSAELNYATTGTSISAPTGFSTDFPNGSDNIYAVDMNLSSSYHSEFKMSAAGVSTFRYGYEFNTGGYQGMSMEFGVPPVVNTIIHPLCGENAGTISLEVTGTEPITYEWNDGSTASSIDIMSEGGYEVTVSDANGCTYTQSFFMIEFNPFSATLNVNETEGMTTLDVSIIQGRPEYIYEWSTGETTSSIIVSEPGEYEVQVTDGNGCLIILSATIVGIEETSEIHPLSVSPNPTSGEIVFRIEKPATELIITNSIGEMVHHARIGNSISPVTLDMKNNAAGFYFYKLMNGSELLTTGKISVIH